MTALTPSSAKSRGGINAKIAAKIATSQEKALIAYLVADISENGARIRLAREQDLPQIVTLVLARGRGPRRFCQVLHHQGTTLGVRFIEAL
jgi:hypothetical protein